MAQFLKHIACPKCGSSDANAQYSDGSSFCFSCRKSNGATISPYVMTEKQETKQEGTDILPFPSDATQDYPVQAMAWIGKYGITVEQCLQNNVYYSAARNQVIFGFFADSGGMSPVPGRIIAWQARNLSASDKGRRYFTQGDINELLPIFCTRCSSSDNPSNHLRRLVLVEDCLSAIKITALGVDSMPCLGSGIPLKKIARLRPFYDFLDVFLDPDMWHKGLSIARQAQSLGFSTRTINSDRDPKEHTHDELEELLK